MDSSKSSVPVDPKARLEKLEERHRHDLMDYEERCELWSRIAKARAEIARAKAERA